MTKDRMIIEKHKEMIKIFKKYFIATALSDTDWGEMKALESELKSLESLPDNKLFEQVYIKSEADLPEDTGTHIVHIPMNAEVYSVHRETIVTQWKRFDWYLRPVK